MDTSDTDHSLETHSAKSKQTGWELEKAMVSFFNEKNDSILAMPIVGH